MSTHDRLAAALATATAAEARAVWDALSAYCENEEADGTEDAVDPNYPHARALCDRLSAAMAAEAEPEAIDGDDAVFPSLGGARVYRQTEGLPLVAALVFPMAADDGGDDGSTSDETTGERSVVGYAKQAQQPKPEPVISPFAFYPKPSDAERAATQQRIATAVRRADPRIVASIRESILRDPCSGDAAILAASLDPVIADALRQVAQVIALEQ